MEGERDGEVIGKTGAGGGEGPIVGRVVKDADISSDEGVGKEGGRTRKRSSLEAQEWADEGSEVRWKYVKEAWGTSETENLALKLAQSSRKEAGGGAV